MEAGLGAMLGALQLVGATGPVIENSAGSGIIWRGSGSWWGFDGTSCGGGAALGDGVSARH